MFPGVDSGRLINLKVISKLKRGEKLNTRFYRFTIESTSLLSPSFFTRWVNGESRDQTVDAVDSLVSSCIVQGSQMNEQEISKLIDQLFQVGRGLKNLIETYKDDCTTCAGIELVLEKITSFAAQHGQIDVSGDTSPSGDSPSSCI